MMARRSPRILLTVSTCPDRRVSGHEQASGLDPAQLQADPAAASRSSRRRSVDLFVPRGDVANILDFPGHFTPKAELITLEQNYRSTQPILAAANAVIDLASERFTKNLWSDRASSDLPALFNVADDNAQAGYIVENFLPIARLDSSSRPRRSCSERRATARRSKSS